MEEKSCFIWNCSLKSMMFLHQKDFFMTILWQLHFPPQKKKKKKLVFGCLRFFSLSTLFQASKYTHKMGNPINRSFRCIQGSGRFPPATYTVEAAPETTMAASENSFGATCFLVLNGASVFRVWSSLLGGVKIAKFSKPKSKVASLWVQGWQ